MLDSINYNGGRLGGHHAQQLYLRTRNNSLLGECRKPDLARVWGGDLPPPPSTRLELRKELEKEDLQKAVDQLLVEPGILPAVTFMYLLRNSCVVAVFLNDERNIFIILTGSLSISSKNCSVWHIRFVSYNLIYIYVSWCRLHKETSVLWEQSAAPDREAGGKSYPEDSEVY
jgi:hypothetical protein